MDLESYGYINPNKNEADQQKDPGVEPEVDTNDERDPEVEEILFEAEKVGNGDTQEVAAEILADKDPGDLEIDDYDTEFEEMEEVLVEGELVGEQPQELGRPSKLDDKTVERLNTGLKVGLSQKKAAIYAGIGESTFYRWQRRYLEIDEACGGEPDNIKTVEDLELWEFWQSIKKAKVAGEIGHLGVISKAAENGVWQASAWFLERSNPEEWGKRERNKLDDGKSEDTVKVIIKYSS